jgi:Concanavalin A-like lectin/glucanases superfamily
MRHGWKLVSTILLAPACVGLSVIGCNALSGVDDLTEVPSRLTTDASPDVTVREGGGGNFHFPDARAGSDAPSIQLDANEASVAEAGLGLCNGLTAVLRFDGTLTSAQGQVPLATPVPGPSYAAGKFGQAVAFTSGTPYVEYASTHNTTQVVSSSMGTIAMWVKPVGGWSPPCGDGTPGNRGLTLWGLDDFGVGGDCAPYLGIWVTVDNTGKNDFGATISNAPTWNPGDFNHLAYTWTTAQLAITLNGTTSQVLTQTYTPPDPVAAYFGIGTDNGTFNYYDDVALWSRVLTPVEIEAVHVAGKSLADLCGLP